MIFALAADGAMVNWASALEGAGPKVGSYFWQATKAKPILKILSNNVFMVFRSLKINNQGFVTNCHQLSRFQLVELGTTRVYL